MNTEAKANTVKNLVREAPVQDATYTADVAGLFKVRENLSNKNLPVQYVVISDNLWKFFYRDDEFAIVADVPSREDVQQSIGCYVFGMAVVIDKELPDNTIAVFSETPDHIAPGADRVYRCKMVLPA